MPKHKGLLHMLGNECEGGAVDGLVVCTNQYIPREVAVSSNCYGNSQVRKNGMLLTSAYLGLLACSI